MKNKLLVLFLFAISFLSIAKVARADVYPGPVSPDSTFYFLFVIFAIIINFLWNSLFIFIFYLFARVSVRVLFRLKSLFKILLITIAGFIVDLFGLYTSVLLSASLFKFSLSSEQLPRSAYFIASVLIFILVAAIFYWFYSTNITTEKRKRIIYSAFFGILSNPFWYLIFVVGHWN